MKKYLKKLPFMIALWIVAVTLLTITIVFAVRPVSYGWAYRSGDDRDIFNVGDEQEVTITFDEEDQLEMHFELDQMTFEVDVWYLRNGNKYATIEPSEMPEIIRDYASKDIMTEREFEEFLRDYRTDPVLRAQVWVEGNEVNAFKCEYNGEEFICVGAIVFTVTFGLLSLISIVLSGLSTIWFVQNNNQKRKDLNKEEVLTPNYKIEGQIEMDQIN